ncbi:uncharacterized protein MELLADRAFT_91304 [Melampsora larici-populina 98AG31]|uniref:Ubiquitin conjugation factor E4 core domain-containing protein n=1 Tax=Melampsora larici-populina (strain 98AG31 / pathotype 3-4-7) TaxID=747676 RepID=F4RYJ4_MELLP|nr:uncharacterized protein MELLADRAFT_91304 [Melampsora larici-populina 98AG31]EGG02482.1 hypothetical protein MELLADRAFT_91304 [Melampsora larici-populina 98AG31]
MTNKHSLLDYNLETLAGPKCQSLQVKDPDKFNFYPKKLLTDILSSTATSIMSQSEMKELEAISQFLVEEKRFCNPVKLNTSMCSGYMGATCCRLSLTYVAQLRRSANRTAIRARRSASALFPHHSLVELGAVHS